MGKPTNVDRNIWNSPVPRPTGIRMPWLRWQAPGRTSTKKRLVNIIARLLEWIQLIRMRLAITWSTRSSISATWRRPLMAPSLAAAIQRSHDQAEVGMNMPWAFYNLGIFHLLLGQPYEGLYAYAQAIRLSTSDWVVETSLRLLDKLSAVQELIQGYEWGTPYFNTRPCR